MNDERYEQPNCSSTPGHTKEDYCHDHGGWGSEYIPCRKCGVIRGKNTMPEMPSGLTLDEAFAWGAEQINGRLKRI